MWLSLKVMVLSWLIQARSAFYWASSWPAGRGTRAAVGAYFLPLLFSSAAVAIAYKALLDPNFGMSNAFGIRALSQDWLGDPNLALFVVLFVIAWTFIPSTPCSTKPGCARSRRCCTRRR